jgi:hypothetical protein
MSHPTASAQRGESNATEKPERREEAAQEKEPVVIGIIAAPGTTLQLARQLAHDVPRELHKRFPDVEWRAEVAEEEPAELWTTGRELVDAVRRRLLEEGWDLAIGLTELPLRAAHRPVTAYASATDAVGLVSVPALGVVGVRRRLLGAVVNLVEGLLGEAVQDDEDELGDAERHGRIVARLKELASPLGQARLHEDGSVRFIGAVLRGNLRLLVGMVRANQPYRVILSLSRALVGALGTAAFALASSNVWELADGTSSPRLLALLVFSVLVTIVALVIAHHLWERPKHPRARERVMLYNAATLCTLALGVLTLYAALLGITAACGAALIPPGLFTRKVGHPIDVFDYLQLAWFVASLATIGGALGSMVENDLTVREATYRHRHDKRTEAAT